MDFGVFFVSLLVAGVRMAIPIAYGAIGVTVAEKSGVLNIGCESQMLAGSFVSFVVISLTGNVALGILASGFAGSLSALAIAWLAVSRRQNQSVCGIIMNIFIAGLTSFLFRTFYGGTTAIVATTTLPQLKIPLLSQIPILGEILFSQTIMLYLLIGVAFLAWYMLYRTKVGLMLRAVGENPLAAQAGGISVVRYRYIAYLIAGFLAGIGGSFLVVGVVGTFTENISAGRGFISVAVSTLSRWNPIFGLFGALVFGTANALQMRLQAYGISIPYQFMLMVPYAVTILSLLLFSKGIRAPAAMGVEYKKESR